MSSLPVVNYGRMERLRPPERTSIPMNLNTICIIVIIICILGMYNRAVTVSQSRAQSYTLDTLMPAKRDPFS